MLAFDPRGLAAASHSVAWSCVRRHVVWCAGALWFGLRLCLSAQDGEIFVSLGQVGKCEGDPKVAAAFDAFNATSGGLATWETYSSLWRVRLTTYFRDQVSNSARVLPRHSYLPIPRSDAHFLLVNSDGVLC